MQGGTVVAERFVIEQHATSGGMAEIYRARDRQSGGRVAVKVLAGAELGPSDKHRFWREAQLLSELRHPAIVRYVGHGMTDEGRPFLAMEWLEGEDLATRLGSGPLTLTETLELGRRLAEALGVAHGRGVVHRDIKPENVHLPGGVVTEAKLLDFGIARVNVTRNRTRTGQMLGTPGYMAPEQARGSFEVGPHSDVWSLGCVLFECIVGTAPFTGDTPLALLGKILMQDAPRLCDVKRSAPRELDELFARMLAKDPGDRPANAGVVAQELAAIQGLRRREGTRATRPALAITAGEQRLVSVVVAAPRNAPDDWDEPTMTPQQLARRTAHLQERVRAFGARVDSTADGSVLAVLSSGGSATDQAARAARCALALRGELSEELMVLGTGRAVLGGSLPVGEVLDRAVDLLGSVRAAGSCPPPVDPDEDELPTGQFLISAAHATAPEARRRAVRIDGVTAGLLDARFEVVEHAGGLWLGGESEPSAEPPTTLLGVETTFVGRERELATLLGLLEECISEPVARQVLVVADAGLGKSRLRRELLRKIRDRGSRIEILQARGDEVSAGAPFLMVGQLLRRAASVRGGEPIELGREKILNRIARHVAPSAERRVAEFLGEMAGVRFAEEGRAQLRAARADAALMADQLESAWLDWLDAECRTQPVLIVLEDLQWGDKPTLRLLDAALRNLAERPLMVLALGRPEAQEIFPDLWAASGLQTLRLAGLTRRAAEKLVRQVLPSASAETVDRLCAQAQGNALYLEELVRAVGEGAGERLPDTVLAMVQARLEQLDTATRRVLRAASVLGERFWRGGLLALLGGEARAAEVDACLEDLCKRELAQRHPESEIAGETELAFRHPLVRAAAYETLTAEDRALAHRLAAGWLKNAGRIEPVVVAEHHERGGEGAHAIRWYLEAAQQALEGNDFDAAFARAERAERCGAAGEQLGRLHLIRAEAHACRGENADAERHAEEALALLPSGSAPWCHASAELADTCGRLGQREALAGVAAMLLAEDRADPGALLVAAARTANQLVLLGCYDDARPLLALLDRLEESLERDPLHEGWTARARASWAMCVEQDVTAVLALNAKSAEGFREAGHVRFKCRAVANLGVACASVGAYDRAVAELERALADAERMALAPVIAGAKHNLGIALAHAGNLERGLGLERDAIENYRSQGDRRLESASHGYLGLIEWMAGRHEAAEHAARTALEVARDLPNVQVFPLAILGRIALDSARVADALAFTRRGMELLATLGSIEEGAAFLRLAHAEALWASGDQAEARRVIAEARTSIVALAKPISDATLRASFLERVPENARTLALAREWLGEG